jgi:hypothetical protein
MYSRTHKTCVFWDSCYISIRNFMQTECVNENLGRKLKKKQKQIKTLVSRKCFPDKASVHCLEGRELSWRAHQISIISDISILLYNDLLNAFGNLTCRLLKSLCINSWSTNFLTIKIAKSYVRNKYTFRSFFFFVKISPLHFSWMCVCVCVCMYICLLVGNRVTSEATLKSNA